MADPAVYDLRSEPDRTRGLAHMARALRAGSLILFPTDTVYGLGADALNPTALERVFDAKGRPENKPLLILISSMEMASLFSDRLSSAQQWLCQALWPGPVSLLLPARESLPAPLASTGRVGLRLPRDPMLLDVLRAAGMPLVAPSANRSGRPSPTRLDQALEEVGSFAEVALDAGPSESTLSSTIVDLVEDPPRVVRAGALDVEPILRSFHVQRR